MAESTHSFRTRPASTKARKQALDILFAAEFRDTGIEQILTEKTADEDRAVREYSAELVRGVDGHREAISARLRDHLTGGWTVERMPGVDRAVLQIGVFEIDYRDDVPDAVAVSEAVTLARDLSTDESPAFVNGLLGSVVSTKAASR